MPLAATDSRLALLAGLFDHAALFPPASMTVPDALAEDRRAREGARAIVLGRFVCPASKVAALGTEPRALSVVLDGDPPDDPRVEAVEAPFRDDLGALAGLSGEVYVEVPLDDQLEERLDALVALGLRAKVRCGGAVVPTASSLARFLRGCAERGVVYKATAGLHHALPTGAEHGFLNLVAAAVFGDEESALGETDASAFALDGGAFSWRSRRAEAGELARMRRERLHSIGSCSFFEPVAELEALGMLP